MNRYPVLHALLRDGARWEATYGGLTCAADGTLALTRVPAPSGLSVSLDAPFDVELSGIVVGCDGRIYVSDTAGNRLVAELPACHWRYVLPPVPGANGLFNAPAGLAVTDTMLFVADSANARVLGLLLPGLEWTRVFDAGLSRPTSVAVDREQRLYVVDRGVNHVMRFEADDAPDSAYNAAMAAHAELTKPVACALDTDGMLFVTDAASNLILAFGPDGQLLGTATGPAGASPRALAISGGLLFAADAATGAILVIDRSARTFIGTVPFFRGPVTAMAFDTAGNMLVKTNPGDSYLRLEANRGCIASGTIEAGALDAGDDNDWERLAVDAGMVSNTTITLETRVANAAAAPPANWTLQPSIDALLAPDSTPADDGTHRFLWLRVTIQSADGRSSPVVRQVHAQTIGTSYLELLPRMYARDDEKTRFLERFLALARGSFEEWDAEFGDLYRRFNARLAPADVVPWLADVLAFLEPQGASLDRQRALIRRVPDLYARRGTIAGIRDIAEIYAGMRPHIFEAYRARRVWQLDTSALGFDTALAAAAPDGLVVPGETPTDPAYIGLQGDYYAGVNFDRHVYSQTDRTIDFGTNHPVTPRENGVLLDRFSVRWSGQIKPAYSETYTFYATPRDGVQLWVDGVELLDSWTEQPGPGAATITLDANRWYPITFEMHRVGTDPTALLEWASRSQLRETIPAHSLYSVLDDWADTSNTTDDGLHVGSAVVGASGPQPASDFGAPLFADYAHLFTVVVPGARCCEGDERRALRAAIDAEKPAHTDYHLCFAEARMRLGLQARVGVDAIVAEGPPPLQLDGTSLGRDSFLAGDPDTDARVGTTARVGQNAVIG